MASIICVSSFPARPTNGSPCSSSSRPGPSPTKTSCAFGLPTPKTMFCACFVELAARAIRADVCADALERVTFDFFLEERRAGERAGMKTGAGLARPKLAAGSVTSCCGFKVGDGFAAGADIAAEFPPFAPLRMGHPELPHEHQTRWLRRDTVAVIGAEAEIFGVAEPGFDLRAFHILQRPSLE